MTGDLTDQFILEDLKSYSKTAYHIISDTFLGSSKDGVRVFCRMSIWKHLKKTAEFLFSI